MTNAPSAWQLEQAFSALMSARARMAENDDVLFDEMTGEVMDFAVVEGDAIALLHATLRAAKAADMLAKAASARADEIYERSVRFKARANALRSAAFAAMDALDLKKVELPDLTATIRAGSPSVVITDETQLHPMYWRQRPPEIDRAAIAAALKAGDPVAGQFPAGVGANTSDAVGFRP